MNIWTTHKPAQASPIEQDAVARMSNHSGCFALDYRQPYRMMQPSYWTGRRGGRGERTLLRTHQEHLTAALPLGVFKQALWWRKEDANMEAGTLRPSRRY